MDWPSVFAKDSFIQRDRSFRLAFIFYHTIFMKQNHVNDATKKPPA
ncbi:hypothetical protein AN945_1773 [Listeria monocytogenes]|nr:hypothetical protein AN945_1773 [Listeria monocytogenes]